MVSFWNPFELLKPAIIILLDVLAHRMYKAWKRPCTTAKHKAPMLQLVYIPFKEIEFPLWGVLEPVKLLCLWLSAWVGQTKKKFETNSKWCWSVRQIERSDSYMCRWKLSLRYDSSYSMHSVHCLARSATIFVGHSSRYCMIPLIPRIYCRNLIFPTNTLQKNVSAKNCSMQSFFNTAMKLVNAAHPTDLSPPHSC